MATRERPGMTIHQFRALTPDAKMEVIFSEFQAIRAEIATVWEELNHFRELEDTRKKMRRKRAAAVRRIGSKTT